MKNFTLVTSYIDLNKYEYRSVKKSREEYLRLSEFVLKLRLNIVFYVEEDLVEYISNKRREYNLIDKTIIKTIKLEQLKYHEMIEKLNELSKYYYKFLDKDLYYKLTGRYLLIGWNKFFLIEKIIEENPFNSDYFGWIDFGLMHIANIDPIIMENEIVENVISPNTPLFKIMEINSQSKYVMQNLNEYLKIFNVMACGYFTAGKEIMLKVIKLFKEKLEFIIENNTVMIEESIIGIIFAENIELFSIYYGGYSNILCNYQKIRNLDFYIFGNLTNLRSNYYLDRCIDLCKQLKIHYNRLDDFNKFFIYYEWLIALNLYGDKMDEINEIVGNLYCEMLTNKKILEYCLLQRNWDNLRPIYLKSKFYDLIELIKDPLIKSDFTLITSYIDLSKYENLSTKRSRNDYLYWSEFVLKLKFNMIFYVEEDTVDFVINKRKEYGLLNKTIVNVISLEGTKYYDKREEIRENIKKNTIFIDTPEYYKTTNNYLMVMWNKFHLMRRTINENPFNNNYFGWIDFGIKHLLNLSDEKLNIIESLIYPDTPLFKIMELSRTFKYQNEDLMKMAVTYSVIACGYFTAHKDIMIKVLNLFDKKLEHTLNNKIPMIDENILALTYTDNPDLFKLYYGNYFSILVNYKKMEIPDYLILSNITRLRNHGCLDECLDILNQLEKIEYSMCDYVKFYFYYESLLCNENNTIRLNEIVEKLYYTSINNVNIKQQLNMEGNWKELSRLYNRTVHWDKILTLH